MTVVRLSARCLPTESRDKVVSAIRNIFPDASLQGDDPVSGTSSSLDMFGELLKRQRIRDAARAVLVRSTRAGTTSFRLNKQVAAVGKISFSQEGHALGDIDVVLEAEDIQAVIDSVAPNTRRVDAD